MAGSELIVVTTKDGHIVVSDLGDKRIDILLLLLRIEYFDKTSNSITRHGLSNGLGDNYK